MGNKNFHFFVAAQNTLCKAFVNERRGPGGGVVPARGREGLGEGAVLARHPLR